MLTGAAIRVCAYALCLEAAGVIHRLQETADP
jgi:hypothetical protein